MPTNPVFSRQVACSFIATLVFASILPPTLTFAQTAPTTILASSTQNDATTNDATAAAEIDRFLSRYFKPDEPGATVIVTREGKPIFRKAYGVADLNTKTPLQPEMVMRIASMTKQFTAVAIMMLVEQGKLKLDDDFTLHVANYPAPKQRITVDQLLTHVSGIPGYTELPNFKRDAGKDITVAQMLNRFKKLPLDFAPGSKMRHNNSAYFLLGAIIEQKSGMTYADFMAKNIFEPLGMKDTAYEGHERSGNKRVPGYETKIERNQPKIVPAFTLSMTQPYSAGSLVSSVDDLARWDAAISAGKLLSAASWKTLHTPIDVSTGNASKVARGWFVAPLQGSMALTHSGGIPGFNTDGIRLPSEKLYSTILINTETPRIPAPVLNRYVAAIAMGKPIGFNESGKPFYLRGSMNGWGITNPLLQDSPNVYRTEITLNKGKHEFKIGSEDWGAIDFGGSRQDSNSYVGKPIALALTGANIKLNVLHAARYRFTLTTNDALAPSLLIEKIS
jgi:D-alanyl-D-alanine carboxypeptidase